MELSNIDSEWPNALRWFLVQNLHRFCPWEIIEEGSEFDFAAKAFQNEDISKRNVFVFASRQDNDDFAGIEVVEGIYTDKVLYFHPVFSSGESNRSWDIVMDEFDNVFEFISNQVVPDMKDCALVEDAINIL